MVDTLLWFLVSLVVAFGVTGGIIGGFASGKMQPSLSGWAVGWIAGFFGMAAVAIFPAIADMGKHPHAKDWLWIIARGIVGWYLISKGREYLTIKKSYRVIPNDPEAIFVVTVWDTVVDCVKSAGKKFLPNWWPFFIWGIEISLANQNMDGVVKNISSVESGVVFDRIEYSITYTIDPDRAPLFLTNQRVAGIEDQLEDMILDALKTAFGKKHWEDAVKGSDDDIREEVVEALTGRQTLPSLDSRNLAIIIVTFSIKNVTSSMAENAQKKEAKKLEAEGKMIEIEGVADRIEVLVKKGVPEEDARLMVNLRDLTNVSRHYLTIQGMQQQGNGITTDAAVDLVESMGVKVDEEKRKFIERKLSTTTANIGQMGKAGNMFWLAEFLEVFGIQLPKNGANQQNGNTQDGETQGENKPPTTPKFTAEEKKEAEKNKDAYYEQKAKEQKEWEEKQKTKKK